MSKKQIRWFYLSILALVWGSSFILMKKALIGLKPVEVGALRILITAVTLLLVGYKSLFTIQKHHWWYIFLTAVLGTFFPAFLFAYAINDIDSSIASILNSLTPLNTLVIGSLLFSFSFNRHQLFGVLIGLAGTVILILKGAQLNPDQNYWYALLPILSSICYAFNVNILKRHLEDLSALAITTGNFVLLIIPTTVVLWFSNFFINFNYTPETTNSLIYLIILAVIGTAFAKTLFNRLVQISTPVFSSSVTYLIPIVAIFWGVLDGENLSFIQLMAGAIILLGVYLASKK
ncbi:MAG: EamA family transporter [Flavobacteriaceae bacterium]|nr:EamA family transporter [Flavobacteriaceae bacterium]